MQIPSLFLFTFLSFLCITTCLDVPHVFRIDINSNGQNNTLSLTKGKFYPITIEIHSVWDNFDKKLQTTVLSISDNRFIMPQEKYYVNTSDTLAIHTFIGINCESEFSDTEKKGMQIYMVTENESFEPQMVSVTISDELNEINLSVSDNTIGVNTYGVIYPNEALLNTNPINIQFEVDDTYKDVLLFETTLLEVNSSLDYVHFHSQNVKYYVNNSNIESDVNGINVKASIKNDTTQCYMLNPNSNTLTFHIQTSIRETNVSQSVISFKGEIENDILYLVLSETSKDVVYGSMSCAIVANDLQMVSDEHIEKQQYPTDTLYTNRILYFKTQIGENNNNIKIPLTRLDKYKQYNYRCIYSNNAYRSLHSDSIIIENKQSECIDATSSLLFGFPSCWEAHISNLTQPILYDENLGRYASFNILEGFRTHYNENGCVKFDYRDVEPFYKDECAKDWSVKSFCLYTEPTCNITKFDWETISNTVYSKLTSVLTDKWKVESAAGVSWINIESMRQIDFINLNTSHLKLSGVMKHNNSNIQLSLNNLFKEPIECFYNFSKNTFPVNETMFNKENKIALVSGRNDDVKMTFPFEKEEFDNEVYALHLLCNSLPGWKLTETTDKAFTSFTIIHDKNVEIDCEKDKKSIICLEGKIDRQEYNDLEIAVEGIDFAMEVEEYKKLTFSEKNETLYKEYESFITEDKVDNDMYPLSIKLDEYISALNCYEIKEHKQCIKTKQEYEDKIITKVIDTIYKNHKTISEYINSFTSSKLSKDILEQLLIKIITSSNAADALTEKSSKQIFNLSYSFLNELNSILDIINTNYKDDSSYSIIIKDITKLIFKSVSSVQNILKYMDAQNFISTPGSDSNDYFIRDDLLTKYTSVLSLALSNLLIKTNTTFENDVFTFKYIQFNQNEQSSHQIIDKEISISIDEEILKQNNITGLPIMIYKTYPSLSEFKESGVYGNVILGVNVINEDGSMKERTQLPQAIDIVYNRTEMGLNVKYCYEVVKGKISSDGIESVEDTENNLLKCSIKYTGDIIVATKEIEEEGDGDGISLMIVLLCVIGFILVVGGIVLGVKFCKKGQPIIPNDQGMLIPEQ